MLFRSSASSVCDALDGPRLIRVTPLIVRLPNHLGDACMTLPALELLEAHGYQLTLAGPSWAKDLFGAYSWPVVPLSGSNHQRVQALRPFATRSGLLMTNSFSTALQFRMAGIRAVGYARDARSWLLQRAIDVDTRDHMVEYYYRLASALTQTPSKAPPDFRLRISASAIERAHNAISAQISSGNYVVLCPVAVGLHRGQVKAWEGFSRLSHELVQQGIFVVAMPGPGETAAVRTAVPGARVLPESDVGTFAAVLAGAQLVVANDSGPAHVAAAVGARLIAIFGVTETEKTRPWGTRSTIVGSADGWPNYETVRSAVTTALSV